MRTLSLTFYLVLGLTAVLVAETARAKALRFVYMQGFVSCSLSNRAPAHKFLALTKDHPDAKVYWGCFDGGFTQHPTDWNERFFLYTIEANGRWSEPKEMHARSAPLEIALLLRQELRELEQASENPESTDDLMDLFIAGHSHGGWMAMRIAYQMGLSKRARVQHLLTIDPVSYELCHSAWFPVKAVSNTFRWWGEPDDCHRAPRDLAHMESYIVTATNNQWVNIYETSMPYLSSGPIASAAVNVHYQPQTNFDWWTAHRAILIDPASWTHFYKRMERYMRESSESVDQAKLEPHDQSN